VHKEKIHILYSPPTTTIPGMELRRTSLLTHVIFIELKVNAEMFLCDNMKKTLGRARCRCTHNIKNMNWTDWQDLD